MSNESDRIDEAPIDQEKISRTLQDFYRDIQRQKAKRKEKRFTSDGEEIVEDERDGRP